MKLNYWPFSGVAQRKAFRIAGRSLLGSITIMAAASVAVLLIVVRIFNVDFWNLSRSLLLPLASIDGWVTLVNGAMPLWLSALAFSVPLQVGFYNIGTEGQIMIGGFMASVFGLWMLDVSENSIGAHAIWAGCIIAGLAGAAIWSLIAWILKIRFRANEVIVTLILNSVAIIVVNYFVNLPRWAEVGAQGMQTRHLPLHAQFPNLITSPGGPSLSLMIVFTVGFLAAVHVWIWWTRPGLSLRAVGHN